MINNVETFINVPQILARGVEWYKAAGRNGSRGLKFVGVSGHTAKPGIYEVPLGITMREVLFDYAGGVRGGVSLKAFAPSGPSSGYLPASMADVRLDFKALAEAGSMLGSGAIVVCDDTTCMLDMALNAVRFYRNESCGKCVPCRVGSQKMVDLLVRWTQGGLPEAQYRADLALLDELVAGDEPGFDLRAGADCAGADSIGAETFSGGSGCACFAGQVSRAGFVLRRRRGRERRIEWGFVREWPLQSAVRECRWGYGLLLNAEVRGEPSKTVSTSAINRRKNLTGSEYE